VVAERPEDVLNLLMKEGLVTPSQVERARRVQQRLEKPRRMLTVLKALKYVTDRQVQEALRRGRGAVRLGSLLVELGYITEGQLVGALNRQKRQGDLRPLGELLIEDQAISAYTLPQALALHLGYPYLEPDPARLDASLLEKGSRDLFLGHGFLPLERAASGAVRVAMADPLSEEDLAAARKVYGPDLDLAVTLRRLVREALDGFESVKKSEPPLRPDQEEMVGVVERLVQEALGRRAAFIHLEPLRQRLRVRFRQDGSLVHHQDLPKDQGAALLARLKTMASLDPAKKTGFMDGRIRMASSQLGGEVQVEVSFLATPLGEKAVLRLEPREFVWRRPDGLGLASKMRERFLEEVLDAPEGLVLIAGPAGSGRTTTLYAALHHGRLIESQIVTAEFPLTHVVEGIAQAAVSPDNGPGHETLFDHLLKQDPDIIVLGELASTGLAERAARAALNGRRVWTTMTAEDGIGALFVLKGLGVDPDLLASTVAGTLGQRLVRTLCPHCREDYAPTARDLRRLKLKAEDLKNARFTAGRGCERCDFTGYQGRTGVFELLVMTEAVREAWLADGTPAAVRRAALASAQWVSLAEDGLAKAAAGLTSLPEIGRRIPVPVPPRPLEEIVALIGNP
jgi:type IV pilus assembly protein PilB